MLHVELIHFGAGNGLWAGRSGVRIRAKVRDISVSKSSSSALGRDVEPVSTAEVKKAEDFMPIIPMCLHCVDSDFTCKLYGSQNFLYYILIGSVMPKCDQYLANDIFSIFH